MSALLREPRRMLERELLHADFALEEVDVLSKLTHTLERRVQAEAQLANL